MMQILCGSVLPTHHRTHVLSQPLTSGEGFPLQVSHGFLLLLILGKPEKRVMFPCTFKDIQYDMPLIFPSES